MPDPAPRGIEWSHVVITHQEKHASGLNRGDPEVKCIHCDHPFCGGASRNRSHLLGTNQVVAKCNKISDEDKALIAKKQSDKAAEAATKKRKVELDGLTRNNSDPLAESSNSSRGNPITSAFAKVDKAAADASVARFYYANGLPFHSARARSQEYQDMVSNITRMPPGYRPPNVNQLREGLLTAGKKRIDSDLTACIDSKGSKGRHRGGGVV